MMLYLLALLVNCVSANDAASALLEIQSLCGEDSVLKCAATPKQGVQYRALRWYRLSGEPPYEHTGVLQKRNNTVLIFHRYERPADLLSNDSLDLLLPNVTAQDSGMYKCFLAAHVGEKSVEGNILLRVSGCPGEAVHNEFLYEVIVCVSLILALVICFLCWLCLKNISILRSKGKGLVDQTLKAPLHKKNLKLIYTPGPGGLGSSSHHHVCV